MECTDESGQNFIRNNNKSKMSEIFIFASPAIIDSSFSSVCILYAAVNVSVCQKCKHMRLIATEIRFLYICAHDTAIFPFSLDWTQMVVFRFIFFYEFNFCCILMRINGISYENREKDYFFESIIIIMEITIANPVSLWKKIQCLMCMHMRIKIFKSIFVHNAKLAFLQECCMKFSGDTTSATVCIKCASLCVILILHTEMVMSLIIWACLYLLKAKEWMMNSSAISQWWNSSRIYRKMDESNVKMAHLTTRQKQ